MLEGGERYFLNKILEESFNVPVIFNSEKNYIEDCYSSFGLFMKGNKNKTSIVFLSFQQHLLQLSYKKHLDKSLMPKN
jgi:hypothetical protein